MSVRTVTITLAPPEGAAGASAWAIAPRPFPHWGQSFERFDVEGVASLREVGGENTECRAYLVKAAAADAPITFRYEAGFTAAPTPDWVWRVQDNALTRASDALDALAKDLAAGAQNQTAALSRLVDYAAEMFAYAHVDTPFNAGAAAVPSVETRIEGSCVEINTFLLAAARAVGIRGQYVIGYWFHPQHTRTPDAHCWLAFEPDGALTFWDVAHGLKWAQSLGARVAPGLNPAGGRRVGMSCGRGLAFATPLGRVEISHFAEPHWLGADGARIRGALTIEVEDPDGDRAQTPASVVLSKKEQAA